MNKYTFFWDGIYSNWYKSNFIHDLIEYNCMEQYMMYNKAMFFGDLETARLIMNTNNPRKHKELGRLVKNYDDREWSKLREDIVYEGLQAKFDQNPDLKKQLLSTKGTTLVEASPYDRIWGIGFSEGSALKNIDNWGLNLLGRLLTKLRDNYE